MRERFIEAGFTPKSMELMEHCNRVVEAYMEDGLRLTLRQLYYQLVSANIIPNKERSYKNLGNLVSKARLAGQLDWDAIEDRVRQAKRAPEWDSASSLMESALASFRLPRLQGQCHYVELWVEKDALAGVLEPISKECHIVLMVNRGYSSQSAMYESAKRISYRMDNLGCDDATILYLGDLDPSGEDMVRDIQDRMDLFGTQVEVVKVALNIDQVQKHQLPPNPAKLSDSRASAFIAKYGRESWEVDALSPRELRAIINGAIWSRLDMDAMNEIIDQENEIKETLRSASEGL